jgi:hypothetical protein
VYMSSAAVGNLGIAEMSDTEIWLRQSKKNTGTPGTPGTATAGTGVL